MPHIDFRRQRRVSPKCYACQTFGGVLPHGDMRIAPCAILFAAMNTYMGSIQRKGRRYYLVVSLRHRQKWLALTILSLQPNKVRALSTTLIHSAQCPERFPHKRNSKGEGARRVLFPKMANRRPSRMLCAAFRACGFLHHGNGRRTFRLRRNWPRARKQWAPTRVFRGKAPRRHQRNKWRQAINYPAPTHHTSSSGRCDPHEGSVATLMKIGVNGSVASTG